MRKSVWLASHVLRGVNSVVTEFMVSVACLSRAAWGGSMFEVYYHTPLVYFRGLSTQVSRGLSTQVSTSTFMCRTPLKVTVLDEAVKHDLWPLTINPTTRH
jgi:hypothetical protein